MLYAKWTVTRGKVAGYYQGAGERGDGGWAVTSHTILAGKADGNNYPTLSLVMAVMFCSLCPVE